MADKIYTKFEIDRINGTQTGVPGTIYNDELGNSYVATTSKNLKLLQPASATPIVIIGSMGGTTVEEVLVELDERVTTIEDDYVTEAELATGVARAKCYATAISMIL